MPKFNSFKCMDCPDRHPLCWNTCESYKKALKEYRDLIKAEQEYKDNVAAGFIAKVGRKLKT